MTSVLSKTNTGSLALLKPRAVSSPVSHAGFLAAKALLSAKLDINVIRKQAEKIFGRKGGSIAALLPWNYDSLMQHSWFLRSDLDLFSLL